MFTLVTVCEIRVCVFENVKFHFSVFRSPPLKGESEGGPEKGGNKMKLTNSKTTILTSENSIENPHRRYRKFVRNLVELQDLCIFAEIKY